MSNKVQINCNTNNFLRANHLKLEWISLNQNLNLKNKIKKEIKALEKYSPENTISIKIHTDLLGTIEKSIIENHFWIKIYSSEITTATC